MGGARRSGVPEGVASPMHRLRRTLTAALALLLLGVVGCGNTGGADGGVVERSRATQAAQAERNLAASQTAQPPRLRGRSDSFPARTRGATCAGGAPAVAQPQP